MGRRKRLTARKPDDRKQQHDGEEESIWPRLEGEVWRGHTFAILDFRFAIEGGPSL
jgi:hypothetical protein